MKDRFEKAFSYIDENKDTILNAEEFIWKNPELGFSEWKTQEYLIKKYERLGYEVNALKSIPGFYIDIDTGKEGPTIGIFGELDAVYSPLHKDADKTTGAVHACGHHAQSAALLGVAIALKTPGLLDNLSGKIRLFGVPAEESLTDEKLKELLDKNLVQETNGKVEFMRRGLLDDVDIGFMIHASGDKGFGLNGGCNGNMRKKFTFIGKTSHAAGPFKAHNALYAATNALNAANALRETFSEVNKSRFHAIITNGGFVVNQIPDKVEVIGMVRGHTVENILTNNEKINRAFAGAALGMNCQLIIEDRFEHFPRIEDENLRKTFLDVAEKIWPEEKINNGNYVSPGVTDMGDVSMIMPVVHAFIGGFAGDSHAENFRVVDRYNAVVNGAKIESGVLIELLQNNAERAKYILANKHCQFANSKEYFEARDKYAFNDQAIIANEDGTYTIKIKK